MCATVLHTLQVKGYATQSGITTLGKALIHVDAGMQEKAMAAIDLVKLSALHALPIVADAHGALRSSSSASPLIVSRRQLTDVAARCVALSRLLAR